MGRLASPEPAEIYTSSRQLRVFSVVTESRARRPTCGAAACQPPCVGIESEHHHCRQPRGGADVGVVPRHRTIGTDTLRFVRRDSCDTAPSVLVSSWVSPFVVHSKVRAASTNRWRKMYQEATSRGRPPTPCDAPSPRTSSQSHTILCRSRCPMSWLKMMFPVVGLREGFPGRPWRATEQPGIASDGALGDPQAQLQQPETSSIISRSSSGSSARPPALATNWLQNGPPSGRSQKHCPTKRLRGSHLENEPCWIRTNDPLLKRQMLYLLS